MGPMDLEAALKEYEKKFKDKSGHKWEDRSEPAKKGKYTFIERSYADDEDEEEEQVKKEEGADDEEPDSKLPRQTQRLMELIFNQNHFNAVLESIGYNANKLPLGKLSKATLKQGFEHLKELASLIKHPTLAQNKYGLSQEEVSSFYFLCRSHGYKEIALYLKSTASIGLEQLEVFLACVSTRMRLQIRSKNFPHGRIKFEFGKKKAKIMNVPQ